MDDHRDGAFGGPQGVARCVLDERIGGLILEAVAALRYGSVEIVVHDGKVVQIDKRERMRLGKQQP